MGINRADQSLVIDAPPDACFDAIVDFETYPEWQDAVISVEVLDRYDDGLGRQVQLRVDAKFREVVYTLHYHHERPERLSWDFVEGNGVEDIDGEYLFEPLDGGRRTRATYTLGVDPGVPVPGFIFRRLNDGVMRRSIRDTKAEVERRTRT
ncbi:MAG TPA: SRPBCC family protein [Solirubrobacterales bacterium]|nr:SRPBCC family protein [Solirubrobacterales bacterium]